MSLVLPNRAAHWVRQSIESIQDSWCSIAPNPTAVAWGTANRAIYVPVRVPLRCTVLKLWFGGGSTGTGNVDMALYDAAGTGVVAATNAAKAAASAEQILDVTDTVIGPGLYYIGLSSDSTTDTFAVFNLLAPQPTAFGVWVEESAYPLPTNATFALGQTNTLIPLVGLSLEGTAY